MKAKTEKIKSLFVTFFDGCYDIPPASNTSSTFNMGVCKLDYNEKSNTLIIHLRRPGLLIGKHGETLDRLIKYLNCSIEIIEVNLIKN